MNARCVRKWGAGNGAGAVARPGFVLMEVLVSVAILGVGVTVLLQSIMASLDANRMTQEYSQAIFLAETKLWALENDYAYQEGKATGESYGDFDPPLQAYSWKSDIDGDEGAVEYRIQVTVLWVHRGRELQYSLETVVPMRRAEQDLKV